MLNSVDDGREDETTLLKIYHRERTLILSSIMPMLENLGFQVLEQIAYTVRLEGDSWRGIDIFRVRDLDAQAIDVRKHGERLTEALSKLLAIGQEESGTLNRLILYGGLSIRQVALLQGVSDVLFATERRCEPYLY